MKRNDGILDGTPWVVGGLVLNALALFVLQVVRIFKVWNIAEFALIILTLLAWIGILRGAGLLLKKNKTWRKMWILSLVVPILVAVEGFVALRNVRGGMMEQSFIDIIVMFFFYLALLGLFYGYRQMLTGAAMAVKGLDVYLARRCMKVWFPACIVVMVTLILIPITGMFPKWVEYMGVGVLGIIGLLAQLYMCKLILGSYRLVTGGKTREKRTSKEK